MKIIEIEISGDNSVVELEEEHLLLDTQISIINNDNDPSDVLYLITPESDTTLKWMSVLKNANVVKEVIIFLRSNLHIIDAAFLEEFSNVLLTHHKFDQKSDSYISPNVNEHNDVRLSIENYRARLGTFFCSYLSIVAEDVVCETLNITLESQEPILEISSNNRDQAVVINNLTVNNYVHKFTLKNAVIRSSFYHQNFRFAEIVNCIYESPLISQSADAQINLDANLTSQDNKLICDGVTISRILIPNGKFYISAKSYINFRIPRNNEFSGIDLFLDMSREILESNKVVFPNKKFHFENITIHSAGSVIITVGGTCRNLTLKSCKKLTANNINASNFTFLSENQPGILILHSSNITDRLTIKGEIHSKFSNIKARNFIAEGVRYLLLQGDVWIDVIKFNLNQQTNNISTENSQTIRIKAFAKKVAYIKLLIARLNTFVLEGGVFLDDVVLIPAQGRSFLFTSLEGIDGSKNQIRNIIIEGTSEDQTPQISDGTTTSTLIDKAGDKKTLADNVYSIISSLLIRGELRIKAQGDINIGGDLTIFHQAGISSSLGEIYIDGQISTGSDAMIQAKTGGISLNKSRIDADNLMINSYASSYLKDSKISSNTTILWSNNDDVISNSSEIESMKIAIIAGSDIQINNSNIQANNVICSSKNDSSLSGSSITAGSLMVKALKNIIMAHSQVNLDEHNHVIFSKKLNGNEKLAISGIDINDDLKIVSLYTNDNVIPSQLRWESVTNFKELDMDENSAYIDCANGYILGSSINASAKVVAQISGKLSVIPINLYNEFISEGGFTESTAKKIISKINAGYIKINAQEAAVIIGSILEASNGEIDADLLLLLNSSEEITENQNLVERFCHTCQITPPGGINAANFLKFNQTTNITTGLSNVNPSSNYASENLKFTQTRGDIFIQNSINKYKTLEIIARSGQIFIDNPKLGSIYGSETKNQIEDSENILVKHQEEFSKLTEDLQIEIAGNDVLLIAEKGVDAKATRFDISGELKIITQHSVNILPRSVHASLMHHSNSSFDRISITEKVISEIHAGVLNIKAGEASNVISALIEATEVDIEAKELNILAERNIVNRRVYNVINHNLIFGTNYESSEEVVESVISPIIYAKKFKATISEKTTFEAAQILIEEEATLESKDVSILSKYNIHLYDKSTETTHSFSQRNGDMICDIYSKQSARNYGKEEENLPTIFYCQGQFCCIADGQIQVLGSKIAGNDVILTAKDGVKIESSKVHQENFVKIQTDQLSLGFSIQPGITGAAAHLKFNKESDSNQHELNNPSVIEANNLKINTEGDFSVTSSNLSAENAQIMAKGFIAKTSIDKTVESSRVDSTEIGARLGVTESISNTYKKAKKLFRKRNKNFTEYLDLVLNMYSVSKDVYNIWKDLESISSILFLRSDMNDALRTKLSDSNLQILKGLNSIKSLAVVGISQQSSQSQRTTESAVDNLFNFKNLNLNIEEDVNWEGVKFEGENLLIKAKNFFTKASSNTVTTQEFSSSFSINVPIMQGVTGSASIDQNAGTSSGEQHHADNRIKVSGKLTAIIENDLTIKGVSFEGQNIDIKAKNLICRALEDTISQRMKGMSINLGFSIQNLLSPGFEVSSEDSQYKWDNALSSIIATEIIKITAMQTIDVAGGIIANAELDKDGKLTDKGNLSITAARCIVKQLQDYDNGRAYTLGATLSRQMAQEEKQDLGDISFPIKYKFSEKSRDILPTIGQGEINLTESATLSDINREISKYEHNFHEDSGSLDAVLQFSEMKRDLSYVWEKIAGKPEKPIIIENEALENNDDYEEDENIGKKPSKEKKLSDADDGVLSGSTYCEKATKDELVGMMIIDKAAKYGVSLQQLLDDPTEIKAIAQVAQLEFTVLRLKMVVNEAIKNVQNSDHRKAAEQLLPQLEEISEEKDYKTAGMRFAQVCYNYEQSNKFNMLGLFADASGETISWAKDQGMRFINAFETTRYLKEQVLAATGYAIKFLKGYAPVVIDALLSKENQEKLAKITSELYSDKISPYLEPAIKKFYESTTEGQREFLSWINYFSALKSLSRIKELISVRKLPQLPKSFFENLNKNSILHNMKNITPFIKMGQFKFSQGINKVGDMILEGKNIKDLPKELHKFKKLIKVDKNGKMKSIELFQAHHILPKGDDYIQKLYKKAGMSINDPSNLIYLPDAYGASLNLTKKSMHNGAHSKAYYDLFMEKVNKAIQNGADNNWTKKQYREKIEQITLSLREGLENGTIKLNEAKTAAQKATKVGGK